MPNNTTHIYCILGADMFLLDFAGPISPFLFAKQFGIDIEFHFISPVANLPLMPTLANSPRIEGIEPMPDGIDKADIVMVYGAHNTEVAMAAPMTDEIIDWLRHKTHKDQRIISVCIGALLLAKAGLLKGKYCTTFYSRLDDLARYSPSAKPCANQIFVHDGNVLTSAGITTGIDAALYFVELTWGAELAFKIARDMVVYQRRPGSDAQLSPYLAHRNHLDDKLHKAQDLICHDPKINWTADRIAAEIGMSTRHLVRKFSEITQTSLAKYIQNIRLSYAKQLMQNKAKSLEDIAFESGIGTTRSLRRLWQEHFGETPYNWRKKMASE
ncbi:MAG: helix-turn-helix domain-containing protein [OCS116 cluster bacterium]|nr:helix-turn-helix domain-containing protein [OCS116 cluster bacterium]